MKKIRILTFSAENSYGAMLQCYALSKLLSNWGYEVELVKVPLKKNDYGFIGNITYKISTLIFNLFRLRKLPKSIHFKNCKYEDDTIYIVGSDQVWNPEITKDCVLNYFFDFLPNNTKRISYAASFGNTHWAWKEIEADVRTCLQKFTAISVRENTGAKICTDVFKLDASIVLDPTLLLDNYNELLIQKNHTIKSLVFFSLLKLTSQKLELINFIANKTNNTPIILAERRPQKGLKTIGWPSVQSWLSNIAYSSFVITDSFHCTVFAIINRKQFIVITANEKRVGRILHLLESLGLSNRIYSNIEDVYSTTDWQMPIDYDIVEDKLNALRFTSIEFLKKALIE